MKPEGAQRLTVIPCELSEANFYVSQHHRHHGKVAGHKFSIAVIDEAEKIRGVAIVGRPVARRLDDGFTLEVNRCCTDGCPNAPSKLYSAAWRATRAMGYRRLVTYILNTETGKSLLSAGFRCVGEAGSGSWNTPNSGRPRIDKHPTQTKLRFEIEEAMA